MEWIDSLREVLTTTGYGTELLIGFVLLLFLFLFFSLRELSYRFLKLHLLRQEIQELSAEVRGLRKQMLELKTPKPKLDEAIDFIESTKPSSKPKPIEKLSFTGKSSSSPEKPKDEAPQFPLNPS